MNEYTIWTHKEQVVYRGFEIKPVYDKDENDIYWYVQADESIIQDADICDNGCFAWLHECFEFIDSLEK